MAEPSSHARHVLIRPELFSLADQPPDQLYVEGSASSLSLLDELPEQGLAVVGTRDPQPRSIQHMRQVIRGLEGTDRIIVSGFARGIDAIAHELALEHGLPTVAIVAAGLDICYPREHAELRERVLSAGGLIATEAPEGYWPQPFAFLRRNRLIAAWSKATWIVEAGFRSGALNTARWARERDRPVLATPSFPGDPAYLGCQILLDRDVASALWETHSLGQVWLDLAARPRKTGATEETDPLGERWAPPAPNPSMAGPDERATRFFIHCVTAQKGGASTSEALDWSLQLGWSAQRFFLALQRCMDLRWVREERGLLISR